MLFSYVSKKRESVYERYQNLPEKKKKQEYGHKLYRKFPEK